MKKSLEMKTSLILLACLIFPSIGFTVNWPDGKIEIQINANLTDATDDETDDIVCRYSTDPAGRPTIPCRARITGSTKDVKVVLVNKVGGGDVRFPAEADTTKTLSLPATEAWVGFEISGQVESTAMNDAIIEARLDKADGPLCATQDLTVLWVKNFRINQSPNPYTPTVKVTDANSAKQHYVAEFGNDNLAAYFFIGLANGITAEFVFDVFPVDLKLPVRHERKKLNARTWYNGLLDDTTAGNFDNEEPDTSDVGFRDDTPGGVVGKNQIYDIDGPGFVPIGCERAGTIVRRRVNFKQFATFHLTDDNNNRIRCSDDSPWFFRVAMKVQQADPPTWIKDPTAPAEDNKIGGGTTLLGYDLQAVGPLPPPPLPEPRTGACD